MQTKIALLLLATCLSATFLSAAPREVAGSPFIVVFRDDISFRAFPAARADARAARHRAAWAYLDRFVFGAVQVLEAQHRFTADHVYSATVRGFAARLTPAQVDALRNDPLVAYVEADGAVAPLEQIIPWGIVRIGGDVSSASSGDGMGSVSNVNVYVLDAGVQRPHPDLNVVQQIDFTGTGAAPTCAHGTRVSGVVAALDDANGVVGVVPGAQVIGVKVVKCDPVIGSMSVAIKGVDWVTADVKGRPGRSVANMSIGGFANSTLDAAVKRSADSGVFYAVAAGNSSMNACWTSPQRAGTHPGVMTVAATTDTDAEASFSNYGSCVDIWAPGANILTSDLGGGTVTSSGTSYAAPHVAGVAALFLSRAENAAATASQVEIALKTTAVSPGTRSRDGRAVKLVNARNY